MRLLLDLDEVLVDFVGAACREWGASPDEVLPHWTPGVWDLVPPLRSALVARGKPSPRDPIDFWVRFNDRPEFWASLELHPWAEELLDWVRSVTDDWLIVSSPTRCPSCRIGKIDWLKNYFGPDFNRFALRSDKEVFASPNAVLIDDSQANIDRFRAAGGQGIIFPAHHNPAHEYKDQPLLYVRSWLDASQNAQRQHCLPGATQRHTQRHSPY